jgi:CRP/FNR family cyclic AMP-dependent transcriptional regulator
MEVSELLKQMPLFAGLSSADLDVLSPSVRSETYKAGHVIVREGRVGVAFFLVISGSVEVVKGMGSLEEAVLTKLGAGDFFGEIAALKHGTRSASVRALEETKCLVVQRLHFDSYVDQFPSVRAKVEAALSVRPDFRQ